MREEIKPIKSYLPEPTAKTFIILVLILTIVLVWIVKDEQRINDVRKAKEYGYDSCNNERSIVIPSIVE